MRGTLSIFVFIYTYIRDYEYNYIFTVATLRLNKRLLIQSYKNFESSNLANAVYQLFVLHHVKSSRIIKYILACHLMQCSPLVK